MIPSTKRCASIFDLGLLTSKNLLPKICTNSPIGRLIWHIQRICLGLTGGFRGWPSQWNHAKCCADDPCCHGNLMWARRGDPVSYRLVVSWCFVRRQWCSVLRYRTGPRLSSTRRTTTSYRSWRTGVTKATRLKVTRPSQAMKPFSRPCVLPANPGTRPSPTAYVRMHRPSYVITPPPIVSGTGYCFWSISLFVYLFICMFLCQQDYEKTAGPICMKFSGKVWSDYGTTWLHFWSIPRNRAMPRCATRVRGLLCFRTTACLPWKSYRCTQIKNKDLKKTKPMKYTDILINQSVSLALASGKSA